MRLSIFLLCASVLLTAQGQAPAVKAPNPVRLTPLRTSPAATLNQDIGISSVRLTFNRPAVKGRVVWGDPVPFGQVWRTGANAATTFAYDAKDDLMRFEVSPESVPYEEWFTDKERELAAWKTGAKTS